MPRRPAWLRALLRRVLALFAVVLASIAGGVLGARLALQTQTGRDLVKDPLTRALRDALGTRVEIERLDGLGLTRADVVGVRVLDTSGQSVASAKRVVLRVDPFALLRGELSFTRVTVLEPVVDLGEPGGAGGGLPAVFARDTNAATNTGGGGLVVRLHRVQLLRGGIHVRLRGTAFALSDLDASGSVVAGREVRAHVERLRGVWRAPDAPPVLFRAADLSYGTADRVPWRAAIELRSGEASVKLAARLGGVDARGVRAYRLDARIAHLGRATLAATGLDLQLEDASARIHARGTASADFSQATLALELDSASEGELALPRVTASGRWSARRGLSLPEIDARYPGAQLAASLCVTRDGRVDAYANAHARLAGMPALARFAPQLRGTLESSAHLVIDRDSTKHLRALLVLRDGGYAASGTSRLRIELSVAGRGVGDAKLQAALDATGVQAARVRIPRAHIALAGGAKRYTVRGRFAGDDPRERRGALEADITRDGNRYRVDGRAELDVPGYDRLQLSLIRLEYRAPGSLRIADLALRYGSARVRVSGALGPRATAQLSAQIELPDLQELTHPLTETPVQGALSARASLLGTLVRPRLFVYAHYHAERLLALRALAIDARGELDLGQRTPRSAAQIQARFRIDGERTPTAVSLEARYDGARVGVELAASDALGLILRSDAHATLERKRAPRSLGELPGFFAARAWIAGLALGTRRLGQFPGVHAFGLSPALLLAQISGHARIAHEPAAEPHGSLSVEAKLRAAESIPVDAGCGFRAQASLAMSAELEGGALESTSTLATSDGEVARATAGWRAPFRSWFDGFETRPTALELRFSRLPLAELPVTCERVVGWVDGSARLEQARSKAPELAVNLHATGLRVEHAPPFDLQIEAQIEKDAISARAALRSAHGAADVSGRVPLAVSNGKWSVRPDAPVAAHAQLHHVAVPALLAPIAPIRARSGWLDGEVDLSGPLVEPNVHGDLVLDDVSLLLPEAGQPFEHVRGSLHLRGRVLTLDRTRVHDGAGYADASGELTWRTWTAFRANLKLDAHDLPIRRSGVVLGRFSGKMDVTAEVEPGKTTLNLGLRRAAFDLSGESLAGVQSLRPNHKIHLVGADADAERRTSESEAGQRSSTVVHIDASEPFWMRRDDFSVLIATHLEISIEQDEPRVIGTVQIERGVVSLLGQTFDVKEGRIELSGGHEVEPTLALTATRSVPGGPTVTMNATGTLREPVLSFLVDDTPVTAGEALAAASGARSDQSSAALEERVGSIASGIAAGVLSLGARQQLGEWVPVLAVESDERETRVRAGIEARRLVPRFMRKLVVDAYVEGILSEEKQGSQAAVASDTPQTNAAVLIELRFPHKLVSEAQYGPDGRWSTDLSWEP